MSPSIAYVLQTLVTLLGVCVLAVAVLVGARRLGVGRPLGPVSLLGRLGLDGRRAVYLVRVGPLVYVVGGSEAGLSKLGELPLEALPPGAEAEPREGFAAILARTRGSGPSPATDPPPPEPGRD
jgi:flagellar biogenesis protein FliO